MWEGHYKVFSAHYQACLRAKRLFVGEIRCNCVKPVIGLMFVPWNCQNTKSQVRKRQSVRSEDVVEPQLQRSVEVQCG